MHSPDDAFSDDTRGPALSRYWVLVVLLAHENIRTSETAGSPTKIFDIGYSDR